MDYRNCRGGVVVVTCPEACPETETISLQNVGLTGIGVLDGWVSPNGNFRNVASANAMLTVTLDNVNHTILLTPVAAAIAAALPAATTSQVGVLETATDAEALAKTATDKIVTPSNFAAMGASTSFAGLIEIATLAEVQAGTATNLAVVPDTLGDMNFLSTASGAANVSGGPFSLDIQAGSFTISSAGGFTGLEINGAYINFGPGTAFQFESVPMDVDQVLISNNVGVPAQKAIDDFLSTDNTSVWGAPTGIMARTTFAGLAPLTFSNPPTQAECNALGIQVSINQQRLAALITDLMGTLKPHAT